MLVDGLVDVDVDDSFAVKGRRGQIPPDDSPAQANGRTASEHFIELRRRPQ